MTVRFPIETEVQQNVFGFALSFAILPTVFVGLRLLANRLRRRKLDASDYCIIAACLFIVGLECCSITAVLDCGVGYHVADIVQKHGPLPLVELAQILVALQILWTMSLSLSKISMLLLYMRIFSVQALIVTARFTAAFIFAWALATILAAFLICQPFAYNWDKTIEGGFCGNQVLSFQITGAFNIVTDLMVVLLPLPSLYRLNLPMYQRVVLLGVFSVGLFTCIVSAVRLSVLTTMDYTDITWTIPKSNILSGLEPSVAIILSCILMLRPLTRAEFYPSFMVPSSSPSKFSRSAGAAATAGGVADASGGAGGLGGGQEEDASFAAAGHHHKHSQRSSITHHSRKSNYNQTFVQLSDNASEVHLRPLAPAHP